MQVCWAPTPYASLYIVLIYFLLDKVKGTKPKPVCHSCPQVLDNSCHLYLGHSETGGGLPQLCLSCSPDHLCPRGRLRCMGVSVSVAHTDMGHDLVFLSVLFCRMFPFNTWLMTLFPTCHSLKVRLMAMNQKFVSKSFVVVDLRYLG